jgi:tetratricopeptide (TPR) repeat protein
MVNFLTQPEIEAVLLAALLGVIGWAFLEWRKSRRGHKEPGKNKNFSPRHQLPSPPANFIGRDEELAELEKELASNRKVGATFSVKHIALLGIGGVGKTALATVLADNLKKRYPDAQLCLNLHGANLEHSPPVKPAEAMQSIIHAFRPEAKLPKELDKLTPIYNGVLNDAGNVLLFLDNAADAEQIRPLLPPANCLMVVTSRTQISLPGLVSFNIDCLQPEKSQELLLKLTPRIKGHEKEVAKLCGYLPLALEVFAGVVENNILYSVPNLLERLRKQPGELTKVDAAFQASYDLLQDDLPWCLRLLAIFPASFNLAAAAAVWKEKENSAPETMQKLVSTGLVECNKTNDRFRLHDLVRQFCDGKITEAERTAAKLRFAGYYRDVCVEIVRLYKMGGENMLRSLELFDRERTHIEAAIDWLLSQKEKEPATLLVSLIDTIADIGTLRFHPHQRISWLESQLLTSRLFKYRNAECKALGNLGVAYADLGNARKAIDFFNQALAISREINYRRGESGALGNLGLAYHHLGEDDKAISFYEQALAIDRETGDREGEGGLLNNLGDIYEGMGEPHRAAELFNEALSIGIEIGNKRLEAVALANLGIVYSILDDIHKAIKFYEQSVMIIREIHDQGVEGLVLMKLGNAYELLNDYDNAVDFYNQALLLQREVGDLRGEGATLCSYGVALNALGDRTQAIAATEKSLEILEAIEDPNVGVVRENLAKWREPS